MAPRSAHRESGETAAYVPTRFMSEIRLTPSILHCEMDALAVSSYLLRQRAPEVRLLEIRSTDRRPQLRHERSIWLEEGMNIYVYGIHYVALSGERVFDLQSVLQQGLPINDYLSASFPDQSVSQKRYWPNDFRAELRHSRDFIQARYDGFKDFPELENDPLEARPPIKTLHEILRESRERRAKADHS